MIETPLPHYEIRVAEKDGQYVGSTIHKMLGEDRTIGRCHAKSAAGAYAAAAAIAAQQVQRMEALADAGDLMQKGLTENTEIDG